MRFAQIANDMLDLGIAIVAVKQNSKEPFTDLAPHGAASATKDRNLIQQWDQVRGYANLNCGAVAQADTVWFLDVDDMSIIDTILRESGQQEWPGTRTIKTHQGKHFYFRQNAASRAMGNVVVRGKCEARVQNQYVVAPGSMHWTGVPYTVLSDAPIMEAPQWLTGWLTRHSAAANPTRSAPGIPNLESVQSTLEWLKFWLSRLKVSTKSRPIATPGSGLKIYVDCPQASLHSPGPGNPSESAILIGPDGVLAYRCMHSHCTEFLWTHYREHYEPGFTDQQADQLTEPPPVIHVSTEDPVSASPGKLGRRFPRKALYGVLGEIALLLQVPPGLVFPALLTVAGTLVPKTFGSAPEGMIAMRTNLYTIQLAKVGEMKGQSGERAIDALHVLALKQNPGSERGLEILLNPFTGKHALLYCGEFQNGLKKMSIDKSAYCPTVCELWDSDHAGTATKSGASPINCTLSILGNVPTSHNIGFKNAFKEATTGGLTDRLFLAIADEGAPDTIFTPKEDIRLGHLDNLMPVLTQVQRSRNDQMNQYLNQKRKEFPQLPRQGRLGYMLLRIAKILASWNQEAEVSDGAFAAAQALIDWQFHLRLHFSPSGAINVAGQIHETLMGYLVDSSGLSLYRSELVEQVRAVIGCGQREVIGEFDAMVRAGTVELHRGKTSRKDLVWLPKKDQQ